MKCTEKIGPTWLASPVRRAIQTLCLVGFLVLFFYVCSSSGSRHHADRLRAREVIDAEAFLMLDPLLSISAALSARAWVPALVWAAGVLLICLVFTRGFCGYVCPLGTAIDLFDWAVAGRVKRLRLRGRGPWVHLKYYLLAATLVAAAAGVGLAGFVGAIPVATRGLLFGVVPLRIGLLYGWHLAPPMNVGHYVSIVLFLFVFALSFLRPRFWCRYVCPSGAVFSLASHLRVSERKVEATCTGCGECADICPFGAIRPDFTTRTADCTFCRTCGGACPVRAIKFVSRWNSDNLMAYAERPVGEVSLSRRGFVGGIAGGLAAAYGIHTSIGGPYTAPPVRPPGSVPEPMFLGLCVRCGECMNACPSNVLQPSGFQRELEGLWTPHAVADWSGCEPTCNKCGQVCPTGAIRALPLEEKRAAHMGLAVVDEATCLPHAGRAACQLCVDQCAAAGYRAIEFLRVGVEADEDGLPLEDSGYLAPAVLAEKCVGCGLCQTRCYGINVREKGLLRRSAIRVAAGPGKEDRIATGSFLALREQERKKREEDRKRRMPKSGTNGSYLPDFLKDL